MSVSDLSSNSNVKLTIQVQLQLGELFEQIFFVQIQFDSLPYRPDKMLKNSWKMETERPFWYDVLFLGRAVQKSSTFLLQSSPHLKPFLG